ncbi:MAG: hypothetical protein KKC85_20730, partial [Gammaproteobacteria bacterium]|nr:hypothetical protein [Gammaproteobacteria bacterium]
MLRVPYHARQLHGTLVHMKKYASIALCGFLFAAATVSAQTPKEAERAGTVKEVRGTVELLDAAGTLRPARAGDALAPIDRIVTG